MLAPSKVKVRRSGKKSEQEHVQHSLQKGWCYKTRFATTTFIATQHCNIVATLFRMVTTLFQHCNAVLP